MAAQSNMLINQVATCCRCLADVIGANQVESSAYRNSWFSQIFTKSLIKTENNRGPRIEPWGTEALIGVVLELCPESSTQMDFPER